MLIVHSNSKEIGWAGENAIELKPLHEWFGKIKIIQTNIAYYARNKTKKSPNVSQLYYNRFSSNTLRVFNVSNGSMTKVKFWKISCFTLTLIRPCSLRLLTVFCCYEDFCDFSASEFLCPCHRNHQLPPLTRLSQPSASQSPFCGINKKIKRNNTITTLS